MDSINCYSTTPICLVYGVLNNLTGPALIHYQTYQIRSIPSEQLSER